MRVDFKVGQTWELDADGSFLWRVTKAEGIDPRPDPVEVGLWGDIIEFSGGLIELRHHALNPEGTSGFLAQMTILDGGKYPPGFQFFAFWEPAHLSRQEVRGYLGLVNSTPVSVGGVEVKGASLEDIEIDIPDDPHAGQVWNPVTKKWTWGIF